MDRRRFLQSSGGVLGLTRMAAASDEGAKPKPAATADTCIFIWLAGGMCQVDTFDPKRKGDGAKVPGGYYNSIKTAIPGVEVCEHLPSMAERLNHFALLRGMSHQFSDHTRAVDFVHTGRLPTGTVVYPSIGSIVSHELGGFDPKAPPYVVVGEPMQPRGPGFLGGRSNYIYITDTEAGPEGLRRPEGVTPEDYSRRLSMLKEFSRPYLEAKGSAPPVRDYLSASAQGFEMMSEKFQKAFTIKEEPSSTREAYGQEFGQRLLMSRRLVERGVRFVECSFNLKFMNGSGWDAHAFAQKRVHLLIRQLDLGVTVLLEDLRKRKMLDRTLVVIATEFGRPPEFDGSGGRGHHGDAFTTVMFGGGIRGGAVIGETDELGRQVVRRKISVPDFHATIHRALGIDPDKHLMTPDNRPVPVTDYGTPVAEAFA